MKVKHLLNNMHIKTYLCGFLKKIVRILIIYIAKWFTPGVSIKISSPIKILLQCIYVASHNFVVMNKLNSWVKIIYTGIKTLSSKEAVCKK